MNQQLPPQRVKKSSRHHHRESNDHPSSKPSTAPVKTKHMDEFETFVVKTTSSEKASKQPSLNHNREQHPQPIHSSLPENYAQQKIGKITDMICFEASQCVKPEQALRNQIYNNRNLRVQIRTMLFDLLSDVEQFVYDKVQNSSENHHNQSNAVSDEVLAENDVLRRENEELKNQIIGYTKELDRCDSLVALVQESHKSLIKSNEVLLDELIFYQQQHQLTNESSSEEEQTM